MGSPIFTVIGLMSGTSLDGVDAAILRTDGEGIVEAGPATFLPYTPLEKALLRKTMEEAVTWAFEGPPPNGFAQAETVIDNAHIDAIQTLLTDNSLTADDIDIIGYHGQTVLHRAPTENNAGTTLQIGRGGSLASRFGVPVVYDFRSHDVSQGGQGAPLAPIYHKALLESDKRGGNGAIGILNIGGVSNITLVTQSGALLATDCGPGNGPLDSWMKHCGLGDYDKDGALSLTGTPDISRLEGWLQRPFFDLPIPRSADRYDFDVLPSMHGLSPADGAATLAMYCAFGFQKTLNTFAQDIEKIIVCGGGRHNPAIMAGLAELIQCPLGTSDDMGWDGDALEAQAFAYMAARHLRGLPISFPETTGVDQPLLGGRLAKP